MLDTDDGTGGDDIDARSLRDPRTFAGTYRNIKLGRYAGLIVWALLVLAFALIIPETFLTVTTFTSTFRSQSITLILALSLMVCLTCGVFDLSVGANLGFGAIVCLQLMTNGEMSPLLATLIALAVCTLVGVVNGLLVVNVGIDSLIATLGTSSLLAAASLAISGSIFVGPATPGFQKIASFQPFGIPILILYAGIACLIGWWILEHTPVGRRVHATGANREAAKLVGIGVDKYTFYAFVTCGFGCGIAAILLAANVGTVSPNVGDAYLLPAFACCFLAATQIKPGRYNVGGLLVAIAILGTGVKGLTLIGGQVWIPDLFNGLALLTAVGLTVVLQRRQKARSKAIAERRVRLGGSDAKS